MGTRILAAEVLGSTPWHEPSESPPLAPPKRKVSNSAGSPEARQPTGWEPSPTHQQTSGLKFSWVLPTRATPSCTQHWSLTSGSLHKPLREPHPPEGRQQKQEELQFCSLWKENHIHRKIDKMKMQRTLYQMKEQETPPRKTTKWSRNKQPSRKRIQNNDSEHDPGPRKKNGDKDWEDARNV